jgi:SagB-type dehydrogenase family enzyme
LTADNIGRFFLRETSLEIMLSKQSDQAKGLPQPPVGPEPKDDKKRIPLIGPRDISVGEISLREAIENRRSIREYSAEYLSFQDLSWLLWSTQGIQKITGEGNSRKVYRTVPSAGGRHPLDMHMAISRVEGLEPGLYTYLPVSHELQAENTCMDFAEKIAVLCRNQMFIEKAAASFFWIGDEYRFMWRHMERGYRFVFEDGGHSCQNLYLACENIGCGCCAIGYFDEKGLSSLLGIDGEKLFPVYAACVGKKQKK